MDLILIYDNQCAKQQKSLCNTFRVLENLEGFRHSFKCVTHNPKINKAQNKTHRSDRFPKLLRLLRPFACHPQFFFRPPLQVKSDVSEVSDMFTCVDKRCVHSAWKIVICLFIWWFWYILIHSVQFENSRLLLVLLGVVIPAKCELERKQGRKQRQHCMCSMSIVFDMYLICIWYVFSLIFNICSMSCPCLQFSHSQ